MGEKTFEDGGQKVLGIEINPSLDKSTEGTKNSGNNIACMTPEKADEHLKGKLKEEGIKLQEKCQTIVEFFTCLTSSVRLLRMRKKLSTFHNVSCQVSVMTKRKFLDRHLAQIVYIIPEAVNIDKVMIHDKKTLCMKPEMIISLQLDIVKGHFEHSDFLALHKVFASRVTKYFVMHPEKSEVPEGTLPEPFNRRKMSSLDQSSDNSSQPISIETDLSLEELRPHSSFKRHFSKKAVSSTETSESVASSIVGLPSTPACSLKEEDINDKLLEEIPTQSISPQVGAANSSESPLGKLASSASSTIMTQTPVQLTPKRSMLPSSDVKTRKPASVGSVCKPAKRFLNFSGMEGDNGESSLDVDDLQCYEIPEKKNFLDEHFQKKSNTSSGEVICQESSSCLPEIVRVVYNIFKSVNCSSITKEELVHKIIMNCLDITERREVEQQIEQLEKLVPNWISKKSTPSGDVTFSINAKEDLESVLS
ncbi:CDT1-like protein a, chloroplastic [Benincasa hispida]|uniref:CDT1-like protein a, chloroplastic n=1 Tax=Benincasa hispida TaxID=102211 RepID=UPI0018FFDF00|nr:CDT1-like protein a, chloroplastic [Benincasa hispida]